MSTPGVLCSTTMDMVTAAANQVENAHPYLSVLNAWITVSADTGTCEFEIPPNTEFSMPNTTYLPAFDLQYVVGDILLFDTADAPNIFLGVVIDGPIVQWGDFNCSTNSAFGIDGDTLGCVAIASSWLAYSVYLDGGPETTTPARSLPSSDYHFQAHSDWQPVENCTMTCMLLNGAPQHNWTSVGNGTYHGVFHELHFKHTDTFIGYRAAQGVNPGDSTLAARQYVTSGNELDSGNTGVYVDMYSLKRQFEYDASFDVLDSSTGNSLEASDWMGESIEESVAFSNSSGLCVSSIIGDEISSSTFWGITQAAGDWGTEQEIEQDLNLCTNAVLDGVLNNDNASIPMACGEDLTWIDPDLLEYPAGNPAPDIQSTSTSYPADADSVLSDRWLEKRAGASQPYKIFKMADESRQTWITWYSAPYVNGANGVNLQNAGGDNHVWALANAVSCLDTGVISNAAITGAGKVSVHAEHLFERVTVAYLLEFAQVLQLDLGDGNGVVVPAGAAGLNPIPYSMIVTYMAIPYANWPSLQGLGLDPTRSLFTDLANALGSTSNPAVMTNLEGGMNLMKARVWDTIVNPTADDKWNALASNPSEANTAKALSLIQVVSYPQLI
jgi:hypothetical protein